MHFYPMRFFNKHVLNHVTARLARAAHGPFALVRHVGRRSGTPYETPIMVVPTPGGFLMALTYGDKVDWYRNLQAAGHGRLVYHGRTYDIGAPRAVPRRTGLQAHPAPERVILRLVHTRHFVTVPATPVASA